MDAADRRPQLPALSYLDVDKTQGQDDDATAFRKPDSAVTRTHSRPTSPVTQHTPRTSPTYSHAQQKDSLATGTGASTPVDSQAGRGEEMDHTKQAVRQSLPSINEALSMDAPSVYAPTTSATRHLQQTHPTQAMPRSRPDEHPSPSSSSRQFGGVPPPPPPPSSTYSGREAYPPQQQHDAFAAPHYTSSSDSRRSAYPPAPADARSSFSSTTSSHHPVQYPPSHSSTRYDDPHPAGGLAHPGSSYGLSSYSSSSRQSQGPSSSAGPGYPPSSRYETSPITPSTAGWKLEPKPSRYSRHEPHATGQSYNESIKRHFEMYDFETALNDIDSSSRLVQDFARRYGDHMHQTARGGTGPSLATLPSLVEIDDMLSKTRIQQDSLHRIRDSVVTEQIAYDRQLAEQRSSSSAAALQQQNTHSHTLPPSLKTYSAAGESNLAPPTGPSSLSHQQPPNTLSDSETGQGGFAGSALKKPRGRAAAPGRCHSCNRAETPEWRRGPDGARTLCNACGLHFAKLTRKTAAAKAAAAAVGNGGAGAGGLRPKE